MRRISLYPVLASLASWTASIRLVSTLAGLFNYYPEEREAGREPACQQPTTVFLHVKALHVWP